MLTLNPPLGALHGARLERSSAVAHGLLSALEHFSASAIRLQSQMLDCLVQRSRAHEHHLSPLVVVDVATDPSVTQLGVDIVKEQIHLNASIGTHWIALGEWHQHGVYAIFANWIAHCQEQFRGLPAASGMSVLMQALESADRSVAQAAVVAVGATEVMAAEAERMEAVMQPRRRNRKQ